VRIQHVINAEESVLDIKPSSWSDTWAAMKNTSVKISDVETSVVSRRMKVKWFDGEGYRN